MEGNQKYYLAVTGRVGHYKVLLAARMLRYLRNQILISLIININNLLINIDINNINNNYFDVVQLLVSFFLARLQKHL